jgi:hypothetical protein
MGQLRKYSIGNVAKSPNCGIQELKRFKFPPNESLEKQAVQPIFGAELCVLALIGSDDTECRSDIRSERYMPATKYKRYVDYASSQLTVSPSSSALRQEMSMLKEIKNVSRKNEGAEAMHIHVLNQMCGHLGRELWSPSILVMLAWTPHL